MVDALDGGRRGATATSAGSVRNWSASSRIAFGMVAEKNRVWRFSGSQLHDLPERVDEAEIDHLVGLVEDEDLDLAEGQHALLDQVDQAAGRGDEHVDAARERPGGSCRSGCRRTRW